MLTHTIYGMAKKRAHNWQLKEKEKRLERGRGILLDMNDKLDIKGHVTTVKCIHCHKDLYEIHIRTRRGQLLSTKRIDLPGYDAAESPRVCPYCDREFAKVDEKSGRTTFWTDQGLV